MAAHHVGECLSVVDRRIGYSTWRTCPRNPVLSFIVCHWVNTRTKGFPIRSYHGARPLPTPLLCLKVSQQSRDAPSTHQTDQALRSRHRLHLHVSVYMALSRNYTDLFPIFLCVFASWVSVPSRTDVCRKFAGEDVPTTFGPIHASRPLVFAVNPAGTAKMGSSNHIRMPLSFASTPSIHRSRPLPTYCKRTAVREMHKERWSRVQWRFMNRDTNHIQGDERAYASSWSDCLSGSWRQGLTAARVVVANRRDTRRR
jgi:hypothetical protein